MSRPADPNPLVGRQPLNLRMRSDLQSQTIDTAGGGRVTVKDPVALKYHSLRDDEWFVLQLLRSPIDLESIRAAYQRRFAPRRVSLSQIQALLFRLHRSELLISLTPGQADPQVRRRGQQLQQKCLGLLQSALFLRFPGIDPAPLLNRLYPAVRWLLRPGMLAFAALLAVLAGGLFAAHAEDFVSELPSLQQIVQPRGLLLLAVVLGVTKICHELGHAIVCKHMGGECHEIGPMLLVFTPALYCDTSDSWMLPGRMQRAAVGAAGMGVELILASLATFVWWYTHPGIVHHAAMNVMLVCSLSTLLFNGNPLLRYDGYYILSDLTDTPNLASRSRDHFRRVAAGWLLGIGPPRALRPSRRAGRWLLVYQLAATAYRWSITLVILWFVTQFLKPYGLQSIGWSLCLFTVATMIAMPLWQAIQFIRTPGNTSKMRRRNLLATAAVTAGLLGLTFVPVTHHVVAEAQLVPHQPTPVYVTTAGFRSPNLAAASLPFGRHVQRGDTLLNLRNPELELQWLQAEQRSESQRLLLEQLRRTQSSDPQSAAQIPFAEAALDDLQQRVAKLTAQRKSLLITAPADGVLIRPAPLPTPREQATLAKLTGWAGQPINAGSFLDTGVPLGTIATPDRYDAWLNVTQADIEYVQVGQRVTLQLDGFTDRAIAGRVIEIAGQDVSELDDFVGVPPGQGGAAASAAGQDSAAGQGGAGQGGAASSAGDYAVRVQLAPSDLPLTYYERGRAKILVDTHPLAQRMYRAAAALFRFQ